MPKATIEIDEETFKEIERKITLSATLSQTGMIIPDATLKLAFLFYKAIKAQRGEWLPEKNAED